MTNINITILTTNGLAHLKRLAVEKKGSSSYINTESDFRKLGISQGYNQFVETTVHPQLANLHQSYQREHFCAQLSAPISDGDSWNLGLWLGHVVSQRHSLNLSSNGNPPHYILATGEIGGNLSVKRVEGIKEKLTHALAFMNEKSKEGARVTLILPEDNASDLQAFNQALSQHNIEVITCNHALQALDLLGLKPSASPNTTLASKWIYGLALVGAFALLALAYPTYQIIYQKDTIYQKDIGIAPTKPEKPINNDEIIEKNIETDEGEEKKKEEIVKSPPPELPPAPPPAPKFKKIEITLLPHKAKYKHGCQHDRMQVEAPQIITTQTININNNLDLCKLELHLGNTNDKAISYRLMHQDKNLLAGEINMKGEAKLILDKAGGLLPDKSLDQTLQLDISLGDDTRGDDVLQTHHLNFTKNTQARFQ